ncbi:MAG: hypothetical protein GC153_02820 [Alphaproteobacteria bacterium]|nr:hypothetical protein [Alphaproteobacteria bacterium]
MRGPIVGLGLALAALAAYILSNVIAASGAFVKIENRLAEHCDTLRIFPGTEDVTIDPDTNIAFVSASDRRASKAGRPVQGGIYAFDVATYQTVRKVTSDDFGDFQPHGISLWRDPDGEKRLFAINHRTDGTQAVEIFSVGDGGALTHLASVTFPLLRSPNDLVALGPREFYFVNDHYFKRDFLRALEDWLALPSGNVVYFDGEHARVVARGLAFPAGVNMSADGSMVYVSEFMRRRVDFYRRDGTTGALKRIRTIHTPMGPDNIEVSSDGALWVAGHPKVFDFLRHMNDPKAIAPSEVIRINSRTGGKSVVFVDTTGRINASSVGAVRDKTLIVGAVFDDHVMVCPMVEIFLHDAGVGSGES